MNYERKCDHISNCMIDKITYIAFSTLYAMHLLKGILSTTFTFEIIYSSIFSIVLFNNVTISK